ncbi:HYR domain-containing protein [Phycicoccus sp. M110.8]|uniref:HYR domain-containing protein n=1 Tax=Phycicoccus sp. M110.8 TaxID=3075433 RepID=UPI0028FDB0E6|nr:HYR domain-containing protein [Phycicoccus sp. M110.8]MDU0313893.1 HYR domain-containing protein [Phycicoccus sp. M110.8]
MHLRLASRGVAALAVALLTTYAAGSAYADSIPVVDGDTAAMSTTDIAVSGCTLPVQRDGLVTVKRNGNAHLTPGADFSLVWSSSDTNVTVERTDTTQKVPATYDQNGQDSFQVGIRTTIKASAASTGQSTVSVKVTQPGYTSMTAATYAVSWSCSTNTAPVLTIGGVTNGASYEYGSVPAASCSWTDDHDGSGTVLPTVSGPSGKLGTQTVSCSKTDSAGLVGTASASYSIVDTTGPVLGTVADVSASAVDASGAAVTYTAPTATDAVDGDRPVTCAPASGSTFSLGSTTVTCSATDLTGNKGTTTFAVKVADTTAPVVTVPKDVTLAATSPAGAAYSYTATATDNVDGDLTPSCSPASGSTFAFGDTKVTCSAGDKAGNTSSASFVVTVQDKTAPVVTVHEPKSVEATGPDGAVVSWEAATATDDVDGSRPVTCDHASGATYPVGSTTVTCSADDTHGNTGTATFAVVVTDTTPPALDLPKAVTAEATSPNGAVVSWKASATDLVDGAVDLSCDPASGTQFALDAPATVTCTATDSHGNPATGSFTVTVRDTTAPSLPSFTDVTAEATGPQGAAVEYSVDPAKDLVDGDVALTCSPASGSTFKLGATTVTCTATDKHGNADSGTLTVTVQDTTPPTFDPISVDTAEATGPDGAAVTFAPHATDTVDATPAIACDHASGSTFPLGATQVTCTATDFSGNKSAQTFTVNVADTTEPVVSTPPSQTIEATSAAGAAYTWVMPTATDLVDGDRPVTCDHEQGSTFPLGTTVVTCSASDLSKNVGSSSFTVTVQDTTAPAFGAAPNLTAVATSASGAKVTYTNPVATDLVDGATAVTCAPASGSTFPLGTTTVICTSTDQAGNTATKTFTVTVTVAWSGFLAPVTEGGSYKQGSTIPVKFALTGASAGVTNLQATLWLRKLPSATTGSDPVAVSTSAATTGNLFRYTDGQYLFNLNTKPLGVGSYELRVDLGDGVARTVTISLR